MNRSQNCRKAITCHFANGSVCRYIEPEDDNQRRVASAILGATRKRCHRLGLKYDERQTLGVGFFKNTTILMYRVDLLSNF